MSIFFQAEDGIRDGHVTGVQTCALPISAKIVTNPVRAAVDGNLLPLIVFVTIFAAAAAALPDEKRHALTEIGRASCRERVPRPDAGGSLRPKLSHYSPRCGAGSLK